MNYYNYFTEIEEHFWHKRGAQIMVSPVDWALIGSWQEAGIPLQAVVAGIDQAFAKFDSGRRRDRRPRSLVYCAPAVLAAAEAMREASVGAPNPAAEAKAAKRAEANAAFLPQRIAAFLTDADKKIADCARLAGAEAVVAEIRATLQRLAASCAADSAAGPDESSAAPIQLEDLDRVLTVLDDKLLSALQQAAPVDAMVAIRGEIARELAPYRRQLRAEQLAMIERQFLQRRLLEWAGLPRLSLFYMP